MNFWVRQIGIAIILVVVSSAVGIAVNFVRPDGLPMTQDWKETIARRSESTLPGGLASLDLDRMINLLESGNILILDARPRVFYEMEHIPGAESVPVEEADAELPALLKKIGPKTRVVTYCDGPTCPKALELGKKVLEAGHGDVAVFHGGMESWLSAARPVESVDGGTS